MNKPTYIKLVNEGIANRFEYSDHIEIEFNRLVTKFPKLYEGLLRHELSHTEGSHNLKDLMLDLYDGIPKPGYYRFILQNPSTWKQLSPVWFRDGEIIIDYSQLFSWCILLIGLFIIGLGVREVLI